MVHWDYMMSSVNLVLGLKMLGIDGMFYGNKHESLVPRARNTCAAHFLSDTDCSNLLFIDADVEFPPEDAYSVLTSGLDVVCGIYPKKKINFQRILEHASEAKTAQEVRHMGAEFVGTLPPIIRAEDIKTINGKTYIPFVEMATGFMCLSRAALMRIIQSGLAPEYVSEVEPTAGQLHWDLFPVGVKNKRYISEDYGFCDLWRQVGGTCWVMVESKLTHHGSFAYEGNFEARFKKALKQ